MGKQDWYDMGAQIGDLVQSAIDNNDFQQLNRSIADTINSTLNLVQKNMQEAARQAQAAGKDVSSAFDGTWRSAGGTAFDQAMDRARSAGADSGRKGARTSGDSTQDGTAYEKASGRTATPGSGKNARNPAIQAFGEHRGTAMMAAGYAMTGIFGLGFAVFLMLSRLYGVGKLFEILMVFCLVLMILCLSAGLRGRELRERAKRQRQYLRIMGSRTSCAVKELAEGTGKSKKFVRKDLRAMIRDGLFLGPVYLNERGTRLMMGKDAYQEYQRAEAQDAGEQDTGKKHGGKPEKGKKASAEHREAEGNGGRSKTGEPGDGLSREAQAIVDEGRAFISHIHECNDAIPDETMSGKLSRLENVVTKIFDQVAARPESAPDLHKMMSYYLPITRKLVDAYRDLDAQAVGGQNISGTKKEIEDSLDTINTAFENLLDRFFQDTAWDISSDISVLHTMMAQDGLTKKDFAPGERVKTTGQDVS